MTNSIITKIKKNIAEASNSKSLKARFAKGSIWLGIGSSIEQAFRLLRNMIFARILLPEALAPFAIIQMVYTFFESFSQVGIREAIIQNPAGDEQKYLNGAWWFAAGRGVVLYIAAFLSAPFIASFFGNPELTLMLRVAFVNILCRGFMSSRAYVAIKKMNFKRWILVEQVGGIIGILTAVVLVFVLHNIWALVIGFAVEGVAWFVLSFIVFPFLPRWKFDKKYLNELFKFARGMMGLPILTFIFMRADMFIVGKICSETQIGLYGWILTLSRIPSLILQKLLNPLLMPTFSEIHDNLDRVNNILIKISRVFIVIGIPLIVFCIFFSKELLTYIYTPDYAAVAIPFTLLFSSAILVNFTAPIVAIYFSMKKPGIIRIFTGIRALMVVAAIYPATRYFNLIGASGTILAVMIITFFLQLLLIHNLTGLRISRYLIIFIPALLVSLPILAVWIILQLLPFHNNLLSLAGGVVSLLITSGIVFYYNRTVKKRAQPV